MITFAEIDHAKDRFPNEKLYVCTTCFQLTALVQDWARCACEPTIELPDPITFDPTIALLCVLCARGAVRQQELVWWQGCPSCLKFNGQMQERLNRQIQMSRMSNTNYALAKHFSKTEFELKRMNKYIDRWTREWETIFHWGRCLARELWETVPNWADDKYVGVKAWEKKFPVSPDYTEQAFLRFTGWPDMAALESATAEEDRKLTEVQNG